MAQFFEIHPENPQLRLIHRAVEIIRKGGVIAYPTDSSYALACQVGDKQAMDKIRRIRQLDDKHNFTLVCKDLTQVSTFTKIGNDAYRRGLLPLFWMLRAKCREDCSTPRKKPSAYAYPITRLRNCCCRNWAKLYLARPWLYRERPRP